MVGSWTLRFKKSLVRSNFMKKWTIFFLLTLLFSLPMVGSAEELGGGYSIDPPVGWMIKDFPGSPYKGLFGERVDEFTPNINIQEDNYGGPMNTYVRLSYLQIKKMMNAEKISEEPFFAKNQEGIKLIAHTELNDLKLTQTFYFFQNPSGKKAVVVGTAPRNSGSEYDPVFDKIMSTFEIK